MGSFPHFIVQQRNHVRPEGSSHVEEITLVLVDQTTGYEPTVAEIERHFAELTATGLAVQQRVESWEADTPVSGFPLFGDIAEIDEHTVTILGKGEGWDKIVVPVDRKVFHLIYELD